MKRRFFLLSILVCSACGPDEIGTARSGSSFTDDAGSRVVLAVRPRRIVSLVPSVTDAIVVMGRTERLVARTRFDDNAEVTHLPSVGGGIDPSVERIVNLQPDLVIGWHAEGTRSLRSALSRVDIPYYAVAIEDTADIFRTLETLGDLLAAEDEAAKATRILRDSLAVVAATAPVDRPTVLYAILESPPRTAGRDTFIGQLIEIAGGAPVFQRRSRTWPQVSLEAILAADPDIVLVPVYAGDGSPLDRLATQPGWRDLRAVREGRVVGVAATTLARPGPSMAMAAREVQRAIASVWAVR